MTGKRRTIRNIFLDDRAKSYKRLFSNEWFRTLQSKTVGTRLESAADSLSVLWKQAENVHTLPLRMVKSYKHFAETFMAEADSWPKALLRELRRQSAQLSDQHADEQLRLEILRRTIRQVQTTEEVQQREDQKLDTAKLIIDSIWNDPQLKMSIHGAQNFVFTGLYFAAEEFVAACVGIKLNKPEDWRISEKGTWVKNFVAAFGPPGTELHTRCITSDYISAIREARNCIAHAGGRVSSTHAHRPAFVALNLVLDGHINVCAPHNIELASYLAKNVDDLIAATL